MRARILNRLSDDLYGVYTNFAHEGVDNEGDYSFVLGARVASVAQLPDGLIAITISEANRVRFLVEGNDPTRVGEAWGKIWMRDDLRKSFLADYEHYPVDGEIAILVGVEPE